MVRVKDYLISSDLYFAVVSDLAESGRYLCSLRYFQLPHGNIIKFDTETANNFLSSHNPEYLFYSKKLDVHLHGVKESDIQQVLKPKNTVNKINRSDQVDDKSVQAKKLIFCLKGLGVNPEYLGITGSLMLGFHRPDSDIDFVVYGLDEFMQVRTVLKNLITESPDYQLTEHMWMDAWKRRNCDLEYDEYKMYETRKFNKLNWHGTKVDFSCVPDKIEVASIKYPVKKLPEKTIQSTIINDRDVFSHPARYETNHPEVKEILAYTATYTGQAFMDETIEARGPVEIDSEGIQRMVIGTSREAYGEYIRVLTDMQSNH